MKNEKVNQEGILTTIKHELLDKKYPPQHTQGELKSLERTYNVIGSSPDERTWQTGIVCDKKMTALAIGASEEESKANAERIVKSVNLLNLFEKEINSLNHFNKINALTQHGQEKLDYLSQLLKQAEGK